MPWLALKNKEGDRSWLNQVRYVTCSIRWKTGSWTSYKKSEYRTNGSLQQSVGSSHKITGIMGFPRKLHQLVRHQLSADKKDWRIATSVFFLYWNKNEPFLTWIMTVDKRRIMYCIIKIWQPVCQSTQPSALMSYIEPHPQISLLVACSTMKGIIQYDILSLHWTMHAVVFDCPFR